MIIVPIVLLRGKLSEKKYIANNGTKIKFRLWYKYTALSSKFFKTIIQLNAAISAQKNPEKTQKLVIALNEYLKIESISTRVLLGN